ncbi:hypothetical protein PO124_20335 [Bacillus licheniformis]|nr:hypothetical protein [Bacillus licheniformis]
MDEDFWKGEKGACPDNRERNRAANIDERIQLMFGKGYGLTISSEKNKGTVMMIKYHFKAGCDDV